MMLTPILDSIDQPLLLCSFANSPMTIPCGQEGSSCAFEITGLFCALSHDDGVLRVLHFFWSIPKRGIVFLFLFCSLFRAVFRRHVAECTHRHHRHVMQGAYRGWL